MRFSLRALSLCAVDALCVWVTFYAAWVIRLERPLTLLEFQGSYLAMGFPLMLIRILALHWFGVYRIAIRHTSIRDARVILFATLSGSLTLLGLHFFVPHVFMPRAVVVIEALLSFLLVSASRLTYRVFCDGTRTAKHNGQVRRVLLVGAGNVGELLAREIHRRHDEGLVLAGFVDDDPNKLRTLIHGSNVLGTTADIPRIVSEYQIDEVIIAFSSANGKQIRNISVSLEKLPVRLRISGGLSELDAQADYRHLRDVSVEDLLRRKPEKVNTDEIAAYLAGERVLVTGAGGSIGSELVRQIASVGPAELILLGHGENSVFDVEQDMRRNSSLTVKALICDLRDACRLEHLFEKHKPTVVFHAAAHKHVPLMEANPEEAITNNVLGTRNLASLATRHGVKRFVMISTDKAVNPSSIMGVSKRIAERVIQSESMRSNTQFATVRFGNVLGSRGSVLLTMRKQIERGDPVTVTHQQATRYFMTIPEAAQLVIQAGAFDGTGHIFLLDMGEPVRILDLAYSLIRLSGLVPNSDVPVKIIGLRPGEKLNEELFSAEEGTTVTRHQRIFVAAQGDLPLDHFDDTVEELIRAAQNQETEKMMELIHKVAPRFQRLPIDNPPGIPTVEALVAREEG